jgi:calcium/calmodulin-dependent protein kinase (CaM kinase) II
VVARSGEKQNMSNDLNGELLRLNQRLLESIATADWATYQELCDASLTAFEPEALGQLVEGMDFHRFYFNLGSVTRSHYTSICSPNIRIMGDVAIIAYVRLNQRVGADGLPVTTGFEETRIWQRQGPHWKHVHFHRSPLPAGNA